jgi:tRNA1Val (adenine37-N6)-methyltransferase
MIDYSQPDFYRFSEDSILLVKEVLNLNLKAAHVLDVCAGSGIVGLEYAQSAHFLTKIDFCEIQGEFIPHLQKNIEFYLPRQIDTEVFHLDFLQMPLIEYDLILSNPPYFHLGHGVLAPDERKNRCRFFIDSSLEKLVLAFSKHLKIGGKAFFLVRTDQKHHTRELSSAHASLSVNFRLQEFKSFSSCAIYQLERL